MMQIEELIALLERANKYNRNRELSVVIPIYSPGGIGGTPSVNIQQVHSGFDWDAGKVFLTPENPVTELTPEQVKEIHESVSKGQSWHAYQKWIKNKEEKQALKARLAALESNESDLLAELDAVRFQSNNFYLDLCNMQNERDKLQERLAALEAVCGEIIDNSAFLNALRIRLEHLEKRLAILEAAVAWHGWDEVPERKLNRFGRSDVHIDLIDVDGTVHYNNLHESLVSEYIEHGFTGWRYPVGDLS